MPTLILDKRTNKDELLSHGAEAVASLASKTKQIEDLKEQQTFLLWSVFSLLAFTILF